MHITNPEIRASDARLRLETWHTFLSRLSKSSSGFPDEILCELLGNTSVIAMAEVESFMRDLVESIVHTTTRSIYFNLSYTHFTHMRNLIPYVRCSHKIPHIGNFGLTLHIIT